MPALSNSGAWASWEADDLGVVWLSVLKAPWRGHAYGATALSPKLLQPSTPQTLSQATPHCPHHRSGPTKGSFWPFWAFVGG